MLSVAVAPPNVTVAPLAEVASTVNKPGTVKTGGVVSTTPPSDTVPLPLPEDRPRAKRKPMTSPASDGVKPMRSALRA